MGCKTGLVTCLQECYAEVEEIASDREVEIESDREIQSNREGERDSDENRDESDVDSDGEIDSESVRYDNVTLSPLVLTSYLNQSVSRVKMKLLEMLTNL
jgi:hypothetical protein